MSNVTNQAVLNGEDAVEWGALVQRFPQLLYDNWTTESAGMRHRGTSPGARVRQLMYGTPPYVLDLRMELEPGAAVVRLVGQVLYSSGSGTPLKNLPILLRHGADPILETATNDYGEFALQCAAEEEVVLVIKASGEEVICLPLPVFTNPPEER